MGPNEDITDITGAFAQATHAGCMLTASGRVFNIQHPTPEMVKLEDIAHHLALVNRWAGATALHYSVAQHSLLVAELVPDWLKPAACLHDGHEYVIGDRIRPFKQIMPRHVKDWWDGLAVNIDKAICDAMHVNYKLLSHPLVKEADLVMLAAEGRDLIVRFHEEVELPHTNSGNALPDCSHIATIVEYQPACICEDFIEQFRYYQRNER